METREHPINVIKFDKNKEKWIETLGREEYYKHEQQEVVDATAEMTRELMECFNKYFEKQIVEGIVQGFNRQHREIQRMTIDGLVKVFGELAKNLDTGAFDARNQHALLVIKVMHFAVTNHKAMTYIDKIMKEEL